MPHDNITSAFSEKEVKRDLQGGEVTSFGEDGVVHIAADNEDVRIEKRSGSFANDGVPEIEEIHRGSVTEVNSGDNYYIWRDNYEIHGGFQGPATKHGPTAWDGEYVWITHGGGTTDYFYKMDKQGNVYGGFSTPQSSVTGLTYDGNHLFAVQEGTDYIYEYDKSGNQVGGFQSLGRSTAPLAWDGDGFWTVNTNFSYAYKYDHSGNVLSGFQTEPSDPSVLGWDGMYLWIQEDNTMWLHNRDGEVIDNFPASIPNDPNWVGDMFMDGRNGYVYKAGGLKSYTGGVIK